VFRLRRISTKGKTINMKIKSLHIAVSISLSLLASGAATADPPTKFFTDLLNKAAPAANKTSASTEVVAIAEGDKSAVSAGSSADPRYTVSADGKEVADSRTRLIWRRCTEGMTWDGMTCAGEPKIIKFHQHALAHAKAEAAATRQAWRVPTHQELVGIANKPTDADVARGVGGIDLVTFPATPKIAFWSSTYFYPDRDGKQVRGDRDRTKVVHFNGMLTADHYFRDNGDDGHVRLVRSGK
jgi:hypothetical protein